MEIEIILCRRDISFNQTIFRMQGEELELDLASYSAALSCCASSQRWEVAMMHLDLRSNPEAFLPEEPMGPGNYRPYKESR